MTVLKKIILSSLLLNIILTFNIFGDDYFELYQKGLELMEEEKYEKALEKFKKSIVANNSFGYSYMFAGWLLYEKLEKPEEALLYLEKAQILMPQEPIILVYFGLAYSKLEKWELVLDYFQRAIEQYKEIQQDIPDWIYNFIASVYLYNLDPQNLDLAITFLNKTINKVNNQELIQAAFRMLAHAYLLKEDYQKAYDYAELCSEDYWIRQQILDENINTTLHDAVANGNLALAAELVKRGADINYQEDLYGNSCLHLSVIYRNQEMLDFILSLKPDLNLKTKMGYTALMLAVFNNSVEAVRALLEAGAWIDARDNNGFNVCRLLQSCSYRENPAWV
jgi:ankyrin repeat protein